MVTSLRLIPILTSVAALSLACRTPDARSPNATETTSASTYERPADVVATPQLLFDPPIFRTVAAKVVGSTAPDPGITALAASGDSVWIAVNNSILASANRGSDWTVASDVADDVNGLSFTSSSEGWAATSGGLLRTLDGGRSWRLVSSLTAGPTTRVRFIDASFGWAMTTGGMERTEDGGQTWQPVDDACGAAGSQFPSLYSFYDSRHGWMLCPRAAGGGAQGRDLYHTTDAAETWHLFSYTQFANVPRTPSPYPLTDCGYATDLYVLSDMEGWISSIRCGLMHTLDGAQSWQQLLINQYDEENASTVYFTSHDRGYVIWRGLFETENAGATWTTRYSYPAARVDQRDVAVAAAFLPGYRVASSSVDRAGAIWAVATRCPQRYDPRLQQKIGRSVYDDCEFHAQLLRSTGGGSNWSSYVLSGVQPSIVESPRGEPLALFDHESKYVSTDNGTTWTRVHRDPLTGAFPGAN